MNNRQRARRSHDPSIFSFFEEDMNEEELERREFETRAARARAMAEPLPRPIAPMPPSTTRRIRSPSFDADPRRLPPPPPRYSTVEPEERPSEQQIIPWVDISEDDEDDGSGEDDETGSDREWREEGGRWDEDGNRIPSEEPEEEDQAEVTPPATPTAVPRANLSANHTVAPPFHPLPHGRHAPAINPPPTRASDVPTLNIPRSDAPRLLGVTNVTIKHGFKSSGSGQVLQHTPVDPVQDFEATLTQARERNAFQRPSRLQITIDTGIEVIGDNNIITIGSEDIDSEPSPIDEGERVEREFHGQDLQSADRREQSAGLPGRDGGIGERGTGQQSAS